MTATSPLVPRSSGHMRGASPAQERDANLLDAQRSAPRAYRASATFRVVVVPDVLLLVASAITLAALEQRSNIFPNVRIIGIVAICLAAAMGLAGRNWWRRRPPAAMWAVSWGILLPAFAYPASQGNELWIWHSTFPVWSTRALTALRSAAARQEDYRLAHGAYCGNASCVGWELAGSTISMQAQGSEAWSAVVHLSNGATCTISVGLAAQSSRDPEGVPVCRESGWSSYQAHNELGSHRRPPIQLPAAVWRPTLDTVARWLQYRGDSARSGTTSEVAAVMSSSWMAAIPAVNTGIELRIFTGYNCTRGGGRASGRRDLLTAGPSSERAL